MKPIFTVHAGEYLVGDHLEKQFPDYEIWVPSKDTGTDLLITNSKNRKKNAGIQVKFSKDFVPEMEAAFQGSLSACGWWVLNPEKMQNSSAELWILAPYSFIEKRIQFIIIEPEELSRILTSIHGNKRNTNVYLWVTKNERCFETRGLNKKIQNEIIEGNYSNVDIIRDFTGYLNCWKKIEDRLN